MIDLDKFDKETEIIAPIYNCHFFYNKKCYHTTLDNGWYFFKIKNNDIIYSTDIQLEVFDYKGNNTIKGYIYDEHFIPQNFDVLKKKTGKEVICPIFFNTQEEFTPIEAIIWEDNQLYYYRPNYRDFFIHEFRMKLDMNEWKDLKGLTPELRSMALFYNLRMEALDESIRQERFKTYVTTLEGRLAHAFQVSDAKIIKYSTTEFTVIVDWSIGTQQFNSVLDKETFRVIEAGYCMSGDDKSHNLKSLVVLAKDYEDRGLIYKTRE